MKPPFKWSKVRFNEEGLVPVIAQEETTGDVLMLAWANREALERSMKTGRVTYFSRSRGELWEKGAKSGHRQKLVKYALDCDGDALLALVRMDGPACHEGTATCFARNDEEVPRPVLSDLAATFAARKRKAPRGSYTAKLLSNADLVREKIEEEADELVLALRAETKERVAEEAADVIYHALVACAGRGVTLADILNVLGGRRK